MERLKIERAGVAAGAKILVADCAFAAPLSTMGAIAHKPHLRLSLPMRQHAASRLGEGDNRV